MGGETFDDIRMTVDHCYSDQHDVLCAQPVPQWFSQFMNETVDTQDNALQFRAQDYRRNAETLQQCGRNIFRQQTRTKLVLSLLFAMQSKDGERGYGNANFEEHLAVLESEISDAAQLKMKACEWTVLYIDHIIHGAYMEKMRILQSN